MLEEQYLLYVELAYLFALELLLADLLLNIPNERVLTGSLNQLHVNQNPVETT